MKKALSLKNTSNPRNWKKEMSILLDIIIWLTKHTKALNTQIKTLEKNNINIHGDNTKECRHLRQKILDQQQVITTRMQAKFTIIDKYIDNWEIWHNAENNIRFLK